MKVPSLLQKQQVLPLHIFSISDGASDGRDASSRGDVVAFATLAVAMRPAIMLSRNALDVLMMHILFFVNETCSRVGIPIALQRLEQQETLDLKVLYVALAWH
jgi:hypothetical protein